MNWNELNKDTLVSEHYAYFDTGAAAPPPKQVIERVNQYLLDTATLGIYLPSLRKRVYENIEVTRQKMADFIRAKKSEIAFTKNGTESICLVAQGIDWKRGDEVIIPDTEMLSNLAVWLQLAQSHGITIVRAKADREGMLDAKNIATLITPRTRLISFVALSNITGAIQPVSAICAMANDNHVLSHVNASQALGMLDVDVQEWQCDFLSACGRKGLRAIEGSGILFIKEQHISVVRSCLIGWWNSSINENGELVVPTSAIKYEAGCPNTPAIYSLDAALDYANAIEQKKIFRRNKMLTTYAINKLIAIRGFELYGPQNIEHRIGLIPFNIKGIDPHYLVTELEKEKIIIEAGHFMATAILAAYGITAMARISIHYFNSEEQIDNLVQIIVKIQGKK